MALKEPFNFRLIWGILMVIIYLAMFYMLVFTNLFVNLSQTLRIIFGVIFLLYGLFRGWQVWQNKR